MKIISRAEAKALGLQYFYTGAACIHGHDAERYVSSRGCVECSKDSNAKKHPLYGRWKSMRYRCCDESAHNYDDYGGRGISVCDRWLDPENGFDNFVADMGPCPDGFSIDRIDCNGNYEPSNCRWTDSITQCRNRRTTKLKGEDVLEAFRLHDQGLKLNQIGERLGCTGGNIWFVLQNREKYIEAGLGRGTQAAA